MIKHLVSDDKTISNENRTLTQKPDWPNKFVDLKKHTANIDDYLADQFGFRKNFISGANKVRYKLFDEIISKQITVGKNGFFYFNSHSAKTPNSLIKSICSIIPLSLRAQKKTKKYFAAFLKHTRNQGIITHIAVIPTKLKIYPEYLPALEKKWCDPLQFNWVDSLMESMAELQVYYPLEMMLELKKSIQVYLPKHFHWHGHLPAIVAEDIMKNLWNIKPTFNIKPKIANVQPDLKNHYRGLTFYEESKQYNYKSQGIKTCKGKNCLADLNKYYKKGISFTHTNNNIKTKNKLVLLTDSFGAFISEHFSRGFPEVILISINYLKPEEEYRFYQWITKDIKPTHLLYLMHDGGIYGRANKLELLMNDINKNNE